MSRIVVFDSENEGQALERLAWIETVKKMVSQGAVAKDNQDVLIYDVSELSDSEISTLTLCGSIHGYLRTDNGSTIGYTIVQKAPDIDKWFISEPESGLVDLSGYEIIDMPEDWIHPPL